MHGTALCAARAVPACAVMTLLECQLAGGDGGPALPRRQPDQLPANQQLPTAAHAQKHKNTYLQVMRPPPMSPTTRPLCRCREFATSRAACVVFYVGGDRLVTVGPPLAGTSTSEAAHAGAEAAARHKPAVRHCADKVGEGTRMFNEQGASSANKGGPMTGTNGVTKGESNQTTGCPPRRRPRRPPRRPARRWWRATPWQPRHRSRWQ